MQFSKETLEVFAALLSQVSVSPLQENADEAWGKLSKAKKELDDALRDLQAGDPGTIL